MALTSGDFRLANGTAIAAAATIASVAPEDIGLIRSDARRLDQVLDHLLEHAVRQTPPGGTVTLAAERALGEVQLRVSDTGRGIPFHVQAHIFDRFTSRDRGGPGLGLANLGPLDTLDGAQPLEFTSVERVGPDLRVLARVPGRGHF